MVRLEAVLNGPQFRHVHGGFFWMSQEMTKIKSGVKKVVRRLHDCAMSCRVEYQSCSRPL
jgi:hypothetical protein